MIYSSSPLFLLVFVFFLSTFRFGTSTVEFRKWVQKCRIHIGQIVQLEFKPDELGEIVSTKNSVDSVYKLFDVLNENVLPNEAQNKLQKQLEKVKKYSEPTNIFTKKMTDSDQPKIIAIFDQKLEPLADSDQKSGPLADSDQKSGPLADSDQKLEILAANFRISMRHFMKEFNRALLDVLLSQMGNLKNKFQETTSDHQTISAGTIDNHMSSKNQQIRNFCNDTREVMKDIIMDSYSIDTKVKAIEKALEEMHSGKFEIIRLLEELEKMLEKLKKPSQISALKFAQLEKKQL